MEITEELSKGESTFMKSNPYFILNVPKNAEAEKIKKSFLTLARKYHPDKNKGNKLAERRFKQINEAYQILSDPEKRKSFDREWALKTSVAKQTISESRPKTDFKKSSAFTSRKEEPIDLSLSFPVSLEEISQPKKSLTLNYSKPVNGRKEKTKLSLQLPRDTSPDTTLVFKGKGGGKGKKVFGNLYVKITLKPHKIFKIKEKDVFLDLPLKFYDALLLKEVEVPTVYGQVIMKIPEEIHSKRLLRLKGMGLSKKQKGIRGDMFVRFILEFPKGMESALKAEFSYLKTLPLKKIKQMCRIYENKEELFPKVSHYKSLLLNLSREKQA